MPLPFALDHVNLWLLEDGEGWTAVDTGLGWEPVRALWRGLLPAHPLQRVLVTHCHPDHMGLASWLQREAGATTWMSPREFATAEAWHGESPGNAPQDLYAFFRLHGLEDRRRAALERRGNTYRQGVPELPSQVRGIREGEEILVGEHAWKVVMGQGHSPEHASLFCEALGILIAGDMLLPRITTNISAHSVAPREDALGLYLESLGRLEALPGDPLVLPSHGLPFRGLRIRVAQLRAHHARRCDLLQAACAQAPRDAASLLPVLFEREIEDPFQTLFAMGECIAHLVHLERRGLLGRVEAGGPVRFVA
ncbi:MAG: MBL fold metallo-hydrolase [Acidobacteria bacterium]|nr:MBL fold metallo-hydrolase [Acidobacteriota bacterium]